MSGAAHLAASSRATARPPTRCARALGLEPVTARLLAIRGLDDAGGRQPLPVAVARSPARPVPPGRHGPRRRAAAGGRSPPRAHRRPRRLRRRRHHLHRDPAARARAARRRRRALHPRTPEDGYGLQPATIDRLHADGVALVVSVDCGIRGAEAARRARELGLDLIITDHHEPDAELPRGAGRRSTRSATTAPIRTRTWPASAWR